MSVDEFSATELANGQRVYDVLVNVMGRENRIDSYELSRLAHVYQPYVSTAVRAAAMAIAPRGIVIGSARGPGGGYYRASTRDEINEIIISRTLETRSHARRDLALHRNGMATLRGARKTDAKATERDLENVIFNTEKALAGYGVRVGSFADEEEDATV